MKRALLIAVLLLIAAPCYAQSDLEELRNQTEHLLVQDTGGTRAVWSDPELLRWINAACRFVATVSQCRRLDTTIILTGSITDYAMPTNYIRTTGAVFMRKGKAIELDVSPYGLSMSTSQNMGKQDNEKRSFGPKQVQDLGPIKKMIRLTPSPIKNDSLRVEYIALPITLSADTDTTGLPLHFEDVVPLYAAYRASARSVTNPFWIMFQQELAALMPTLQPYTEPEPPATEMGL